MYRTRDELSRHSALVRRTRRRLSAPLFVSSFRTKISYFDDDAIERSRIRGRIWVSVCCEHEASSAGVAWSKSWGGSEGELVQGCGVPCCCPAASYRPESATSTMLSGVLLELAWLIASCILREGGRTARILYISSIGACIEAHYSDEGRGSGDQAKRDF